MKMKTFKGIGFTTMMLCGLVILPIVTSSQTISGIVTDSFGTPLQNVTVMDQSRKNETTTENNGTYKIDVSPESEALIFTLSGFKKATVNIDGRIHIDISLVFDMHNHSGMIDMGYYSQKRDDVLGSVSYVQGQVLEKTPTVNLSQTFEGRLPGVITKLNNAELSQTSVSTFVRGLNTISISSTVYVVDGIIYTGQSWEHIVPQEIESITVLKDASSLALYGIQGAAGVIVITTKRGQKGKLNISTSVDQSFQQMNRTPLLIDSWKYAELRNEAAANDHEKLPYTEIDIEQYKAETEPLFYPNTNYYRLMIKPFAQMQRANVTISGGNDKVRSFSSVSMMNQGLQFITEDASFPSNLRTYNSTPHNLWFMYRSNLDITINNIFSGFIRLSGAVRKEHTAGAPNTDIYAAMLHIPPTVYGPYATLEKDPDDSLKLIGGQIIATNKERNPAYGRLNRSGYTNATLSNTALQTGIRLDLNSMVKGLSVEGQFAFQMNAKGYLSAFSNYERARLNNFYEFETTGTDINQPLVYSKSSVMDYYLLGRGQINYQRIFGKHGIQALAFAHAQSFVPESTNGLEYFDYNRINSGAMLAYSFDERLLVKADVGYSGSEQFAPGHHFSVTPAFAIGWNVYKESFFSDKQWLTNLKLRASYGITANDKLGEKRYLFSDDIKKEGASYMPSIPQAISEYQRGNPDLAPQKVEMTNFGIDIGLFNELSWTIDIFRETSNNMIVGSDSRTGSVAYLGIPLYYQPYRNIGKLQNHGFDTEINYLKRINNNLTFSAGGNFVFAQNKVLDIDEAAQPSDYAFQFRSTNYPVGQTWGYLVDKSNGNGYFNIQEEIDALHYAFGTPRLGDLKYRDLNNDGIINEKDLAPIGWGNIPQMSLGIYLGMTYKNFEISCLFQGVDRIKYAYALQEFEYDGIFSDLHLNAWTQERFNDNEKITYPALSLSSSTSTGQPNDFMISNGGFLRLKNLIIIYNLPQKWREALSAEELKLTLTGHNLITWDRMKTKNIDPELTSVEQFQNYRIFNVGVKVLF